MGGLRFYIILPDGLYTEEDREAVRIHVTEEAMRIFGKDIKCTYYNSPQEDWSLSDLCNAIGEMAEADVVYFCKYCTSNPDTKALKEIVEGYHLYTLDRMLEE